MRFVFGSLGPGQGHQGRHKYAVPADQNLYLTLSSTEPTKDGDRTIPPGQSYTALFKADDATFTVPGPDGRGIPPGKYTVTVTQKFKREAVDKKNEKVNRSKGMFDRDTDTFDGRFGENRSPFVFDVDGKAALTVDLDKPSKPLPGVAQVNP